ncbi:hypothetical protein [Sulfurovum sp.]|uniref:hypothetical protein n=1 Tax=Sulfurovum sp. TaxID=1969726 RepID=UPI0025E39AB7|nr:hypothetical protein [Sulfurovum sp.]
MKALIVVGILATFGLIFFLYYRNRDLKKLLIALGTFVLLISFGIMGNITRQIIPLFLAHVILVVFAWGGLLYYLFRGKYYWWVIFSPAVTLALFIALSLLEGSRYEDVFAF